MTSYEFTVTPTEQPRHVAETIHTFGIAHLPGYLDPETTQAVADQGCTLLDHDAPWVAPLEYSIGKSVLIEAPVSPSPAGSQPSRTCSPATTSEPSQIPS